jgi:hypothetical protein
MDIDDVLDSRSPEIHELFSGIRIGCNKIFNYKKLRKPTLLGETFLTNKEVCKMLGLGLRTLQDYRERGHLAYYKIADRSRIKADKNDLSYVKIEIVDRNGNVIPDAAIPVEIKCSGDGRVIASGNGSYDDMKSFRSLTPCTFRGKAIAIIQPTEKKGTIQLAVSAGGLPEASLMIETYE